MTKETTIPTPAADLVWALRSVLIDTATMQSRFVPEMVGITEFLLDPARIGEVDQAKLGFVLQTVVGPLDVAINNAEVTLHEMKRLRAAVWMHSVLEESPGK